MVSARRSETWAASSGASISMSTSKRREPRRSAAVAPCRPSKPMRESTTVGMSASLPRVGESFLLHLALDDLALDRTDHVDQQPPGQVVALVLQGPAIEGHPLHGEGLALDVQRLDGGPHAPLDGHEDAREGQAALVSGLGLVRDG